MVTFVDDVEVQLIDKMGDDILVINAARVSTKGAASLGMNENARGLVGYLMKNRHGSPFEHGVMTFRVTAPIVVWREHMRHRIGFSYNEESGRYKIMDGVFYRPRVARTQTGKPGQYILTTNPMLTPTMTEAFTYANEVAWNHYQNMLDAGIAREVARMVLPLNIMSTAYVTMNPRSMMNFLSLRVNEPNAKFPSHPLEEIDMVGRKYERIFKTLWPITHAAFVEHGRVAP